MVRHDPGIEITFNERMYRTTEKDLNARTIFCQV
jgi:hypothetical protein